MIDVTKLTDAVKQLDPTKIDIPKIDIPKIDLPRIDLGKLADDLPTFDRPDIDVCGGVERLADLARDITYAGIGMWVIAAQAIDGELRKVAAKVA